MIPQLYRGDRNNGVVCFRDMLGRLSDKGIFGGGDPSLALSEFYTLAQVASIRQY